MTAAQERVGEVRLRLHRRLLESERVDLERFQGRTSGAELLQVAADSLRLARLAPDDALETDEPFDVLLAGRDRSSRRLTRRCRSAIALGAGNDPAAAPARTPAGVFARREQTAATARRAP